MAASRLPKLPSSRLTHPNLPWSLDVHAAQSCRRFSTTPITERQHRRTLRRRTMENWLRGPGAVYKDPIPGLPNYLGTMGSTRNRHLADKQKREKEGGSAKKAQSAASDEVEDGEQSQHRSKIDPPLIARPFTLNPYFISEPVLSETMRDRIYQRVVGKGQTVREVSIDLRVSMERVAAVVRLMSVEQEWVRKGQPLNKGYQKTVLGMLPLTEWDPEINSPARGHENINDLPVHFATTPQIFYPAPESKAFTRADAGRAFSPELLPAEDRIPHPEMVQSEIEKAEGSNQSVRRTRLQQRIQEMETQKQEAEEKAKAREARRTTVVEGLRWDFRFKEVNVESAGKHGRGRNGVGWRYGAPHEDRKRGQVKIPTKVE